jgi:4a-hydroxytetrahydrobiopterin dehydratase
VGGVAHVFSVEEVAEALAGLPEWSGDPEGIRRTVNAASFLAAIKLVDAVAVVAEEVDHHPDIDIRWRKVTFVLSTHSAGGVTKRDISLARRIDDLANELAS